MRMLNSQLNKRPGFSYELYTKQDLMSGNFTDSWFVQWRVRGGSKGLTLLLSNYTALLRSILYIVLYILLINLSFFDIRDRIWLQPHVDYLIYPALGFRGRTAGFYFGVLLGVFETKLDVSSAYIAETRPTVSICTIEVLRYLPTNGIRNSKVVFFYPP